MSATSQPSRMLELIAANQEVENIARFIVDRLVLPAPAKLASVTVHETCLSRCELVVC